MNAFTNFYQGFNQEEVAQGNNIRKATSGQIKYYNDLCTQRNMQPKEVNNLSYDEVSKMIKELMSFYPASKAQLDLISDKITIISGILDNMSFTEEQTAMFERDENNVVRLIVADIIRKRLVLSNFTSNLTGGKEGTASKLIAGLIEVEKYFNDITPPTEKQVGFILSMYFCPEVDFEGHGLQLKVSLSDETWRRVTPEELTQQINTVFTNKSASEFINKYNAIFAEWKKTRIRPEQLRYIKELENQLSNDSKLSEVQQATDIEGNTIELTTNKIEYVKGKTYIPHTDEQLIQMSVEQASAFINQLQSEKVIKDEKEYSIEVVEDRGVKTIQGAIEKEFKVLDDLMYSLEAMAGYNDEQLHQSICINMIEDPFNYPENCEYIRNFISDMLEHKAITYLTVLEIATQSTTLQQILLNM